MNDYPVMYVLMRSDLESLNPGKAMAQACHASDLLKYSVGKFPDIHPINEIYKEWLGQTSQGFGTVIVLDVGTERSLENIVSDILEGDTARAIAGIVHDPTYPLRDGRVTHQIPLNTCGFAFGRSSFLSNYTKELKLYK